MRARYRYSSHNTKHDAHEALNDYFVSGEIFASEFAGIERMNGRWHILLWAE